MLVRAKDNAQEMSTIRDLKREISRELGTYIPYVILLYTSDAIVAEDDNAEISVILPQEEGTIDAPKSFQLVICEQSNLTWTEKWKQVVEDHALAHDEDGLERALEEMERSLCGDAEKNVAKENAEIPSNVDRIYVISSNEEHNASTLSSEHNIAFISPNKEQRADVSSREEQGPSTSSSDHSAATTVIYSNKDQSTAISSNENTSAVTAISSNKEDSRHATSKNKEHSSATTATSSHEEHRRDATSSSDCGAATTAICPNEQRRTIGDVLSNALRGLIDRRAPCEAIRYVLTCPGCDVNASRDDEDFSFPLIMCAARNYVPEVEMLLEHGADVNQCGTSQAPALLFAAYFGRQEAVETLLKHGAEINKQTVTGWSPLMSASQQGHIGAVRMLMDRNADVNLTSTDNRTALMSAAHMGHQDICALLCEDETCNMNTQNQAGKTALMIAAQESRGDIVHFLLTKIGTPGRGRGADMVNKHTSDGWSALSLAAVCGSVPSVQALMEAHADVNARTRDGWTPLMTAVRKNYADICALLCEDPAIGLDVECDGGWTALALASHMGNNQIVDTLLQANTRRPAPSEHAHKQLNEALMIAMHRGHQNVVDMLLEAVQKIERD